MPKILFNCMDSNNTPVSRKGGWFDIPLSYDLTVDADTIVKITFDLKIKMPKGYEAIIQPRSSTLEKYCLISSGFGVIEDSYCGPNDLIGYRFYAMRSVKIPKGTYLVQMRFQEKMKDYTLQAVESDEFTGPNRGGFGSSDKEEFELYYDGYRDGEEKGYDDGFEAGYDQAVNDLTAKRKKEHDKSFTQGYNKALADFADLLKKDEKQVRQ